MTNKWLKPPVQIAPLRYLLVPPAILAVFTALALFVHSNVDIAFLWSQCHARERIPALSRIPALGTPSCFIVSFFHIALDSLRSKAVMAVILAYVGALAIVCHIEAARTCNRAYPPISRPTLPWLVFNLIGGALIWQLVIAPAFIHRARTLFLVAEKKSTSNDEATSQPSQADLDLAGEPGRTLPDSEVVAIPIAVAIGYFLPSFLMLFLNTPATIFVWLFFPVYVGVIRVAVRHIVERVQRPANIYFASHPQAIGLLYALPLILSVLAHVFFIWNMTQQDDRRKMVKLTVSFIEIDIQFIFWTVLYWVFVEAGWKLPLAIIGTTIVTGPGGGLCLGWLYREKLLKQGFDSDGEEESAEDNQEDEETPLLRS